MSDTTSDTKVAIVTGAATGIGRAIGQALNRDGYAIAAIGRRRESLEETKKIGFHPYICDIGDEKQVNDTIAQVLSDLGRIDVLINNAGIIRVGMLEDMAVESIDDQLQINLAGTIYMTKACAPALRETAGSIINISSGLASKPVPAHAVYTATKGAVEAFSRAMALELHDSGVRVNVIAPSLVRSDIYVADGMGQADYDKLHEELGKQYLMGRSGEPEDVAELAAFLVSDKASWMTGTVYPVDSGYRSVGNKPSH